MIIEEEDWMRSKKQFFGSGCDLNVSPVCLSADGPHPAVTSNMTLTGLQTNTASSKHTQREEKELQIKKEKVCVYFLMSI